MCMFQINNKNESCVKCGMEPAKYCETCHQRVISQNARLQFENGENEHKLKVTWKLIEQKDRYISDLEYIRNCYYKEKERKEQESKIFRKDKK